MIKCKNHSWILLSFIQCSKQQQRSQPDSQRNDKVKQSNISKNDK